LKPRTRAALLFLALALLAAAFRFPRLAERPMHADEAVNADKLGALLEQGRYAYSPEEFHGPALYYLSLAAARAQGIERYADLTEISLRALPALLGVLLVAAHFLLAPYLGLPAAACSALFTAVSPAMVYYSRDYIHETLFVFLTFCLLLAVFAYGRRGSVLRALGIGALVGLMYATKETMILPVGCMIVAGAPRVTRLAPVALAAGMALLVAALLMSSFLSHPRGILDSVLAYRTYFARGAGLHTFHVHPWHFYFDRLLYFHSAGAPVWSEALIVALALPGLCAALATPGVPRFLALYTVLLAAAYSAIPYKAPWNLLGFLHGIILLAGIGMAWLLQRARRPAYRAALLVLLALGAAHLGWQARAASFQYAADPRNPWVYAQTGTDVFAITARIEALAAAHPAGRALPIQIVTRENLWPLPWYLRRFSGVRWWDGVSTTAPAAPVILATPDMEPALLHRLYDLPPPGQRDMYVPMFDRYVELRPRVEVRGYVAKTLWDNLRETP
jgi:uncharacterized protein (TIGR03663 family)